MSDDYKKLDNENLKKLVEQVKDMHIHGINLVSEKGPAKEMINEILALESFDEEIEQMLANFDEETTDLTKLETQIILLIRRYINAGKKNQNLKKDLNIDEKALAQNIKEMSKYLTDYKREIDNKNNHDLKNKNEASKIRNISKQSRQDMKKIIKNFAVYQVYKIMNPRRIAGETKRDNFIHNMLVGGMKRAKHYTGGKSQDLANYSPNFIKYLENKSKSFFR